MKYFIIAGEPSGDILGARLIKAIKAQDPNAEFVGIGGDLMQGAGLESLIDMSDLTVMGIWEVIMRLPHLRKIFYGLLSEIEKYDPHALITIDFPDFNFRVSSAIRKRGKTKAKLIHYVAPTVWAWRPKRAEKIAKFLDAIMCLFPFEPEYFQKHDLAAVFVGHPMVQDSLKHVDGNDFRNEREIPDDGVVVSFLLGSRPAELKNHSEKMLEVATYLSEKYGERFYALFPTLPHLEFDLIEATKGLSCNKFIIPDQTKKWDMLKASNAAVSVSGTAALELAYAGTPHVVVYKTSPLTFLIARMMAKVKFIHLANIMLDKAVIPEYLQSKFKSEFVAAEILNLLENTEDREKQQDAFLNVQSMLGGEDEKPSVKAARYISKILGKT